MTPVLTVALVVSIWCLIGYLVWSDESVRRWRRERDELLRVGGRLYVPDVPRWEPDPSPDANPRDAA